ncbi:MAG TPA: Gfo/Idh/MocA family oxidoreductase [Verrucomicrobiae bacterium]|jgi:predicted dehydrogenase|nr:Gfo/Idh/MocA family oxidoreductase [Verrucomicrobiae bacterium]
MKRKSRNHSFQISRRSFLAKCTAAAAATGLPLWFIQRNAALAAEAAADSPGRPKPNDRPGIALIGCGGMGTGDAQNASSYGDILAVCDVNEEHLDAAVKHFTKDGKVPAKYSDFRKVMERDDVHIIAQATPDHWHTLINMAAANAKKDIYGEKPLTLTIDEGKHVIRAVRDNKIVFQTGTQQRSSQRFHLACELVRNGRIGKLQEVDVWVPAGLREGPFKTDQVAPPTMNFDFWLGQAPQVNYMKERCENTFRWWWDYAGGPVTDWGAHHNDIARWGIGEDGPIGIEANVITGPIPGGFTTPSEFEATLTWKNGVKQRVRTTRDDSPFGEILKADGQRNGVKFIGSDGWIWVNRNEITASDKELLRTPLPENAVHLEVSHNHMGNFFECVRSRKDPIAKIEDGHLSAVIGHLIIIALRTGLRCTWDPAREVFTGADAEQANRHLAREMRKPYDYSFVA